MTDVEVPSRPDAEAPNSVIDGAEALGVSSRKRPRLDLEGEPRKKSRSIFGQVFGTLKKARDDDKQAKSNDAAKKRKEIDDRIMGKITRDQTLVRKQDEAKRDRQNASRKEEDLAIKDGIMRFRQQVFPRLAGFLLTTDIIPTEDLEATAVPADAPLAHPPRKSQPPALYYRPAVLTKAQAAFLNKQKEAATHNISEEMKEWVSDKAKGIEEVAELRKKAAEALNSSSDEKPSEDTELKEDGHSKEDASLAAAVPTTDDKMEVEDKVGEAGPAKDERPSDDKDKPVPAAVMDTEDTIEY